MNADEKFVTKKTSESTVEKELQGLNSGVKAAVDKRVDLTSTFKNQTHHFKVSRHSEDIESDIFSKGFSSRAEALHVIRQNEKKKITQKVKPATNKGSLSARSQVINALFFKKALNETHLNE